MNKRLTLSVLAGFLGLSILLVSVPSPSLAGPLAPQSISRYAANFLQFGGDEFSTKVRPLPVVPVFPFFAEPPPFSPGLENIYHKSVKVPANVNTLYVTIEATGDGNDGAATLLSCVLDEVSFCNAGAPFSSGVSGWIRLQQHDSGDDFQDNNINYTLVRADLQSNANRGNRPYPHD